MWDKDTSAFLTGQEASRPMWDRTVEHIEKFSKSKTKIGMVWLKLIILETISGVLDNLVNWRKFCQIFKICPHSARPRPARWLLTPRWVDLGLGAANRPLSASSPTLQVRQTRSAACREKIIKQTFSLTRRVNIFKVKMSFDSWLLKGSVTRNPFFVRQGTGKVKMVLNLKTY